MADRITLDWRRADALTDRQRAICALAEKVTRSPVECEEADLDALRAHGLPTRTRGTSSRWRRCTTSPTGSPRPAGRSRTPSTTPWRAAERAAGGVAQRIERRLSSIACSALARVTKCGPVAMTPPWSGNRP